MVGVEGNLQRDDSIANAAKKGNEYGPQTASGLELQQLSYLLRFPSHLQLPSAFSLQLRCSNNQTNSFKTCM